MHTARSPGCGGPAWNASHAGASKLGRRASRRRRAQASSLLKASRIRPLVSRSPRGARVTARGMLLLTIAVALVAGIWSYAWHAAALPHRAAAELWSRAL